MENGALIVEEQKWRKYVEESKKREVRKKKKEKVRIYIYIYIYRERERERDGRIKKIL